MNINQQDKKIAGWQNGPNIYISFLGDTYSYITLGLHGLVCNQVSKDVYGPGTKDAKDWSKKRLESRLNNLKMFISFEALIKYLGRALGFV